MSREIVKSIKSTQSNSTQKHKINKTETVNKENVILKDIHQQSSKENSSKALNVTRILKDSNNPSVVDTNIPSSSSTSSLFYLLNNYQKAIQRVAQPKSENTYSRTQFNVYNENDKHIPSIQIESEMDRPTGGTLFSKSKQFYLHQQQIASCSTTKKNSSPAKKILEKKTSRDLFKKGMEVFLIREEVEKLEKKFDLIQNNQYSSYKNIKTTQNHRITQLKNENLNLNEDHTPYDINNIPPARDTIKIQHKRSTANSNIRLNSALPPQSSNEIISLLYNEDIMNFYLQKEKSRRTFNPNFRLKNITSLQRNLLINHLIKINKDHNYSSFISYQAVRLLDDMLAAKRIYIQQLQLVELSSLWIVMKNLLLSYVLPSSSKIVSFSDHAYTIENLYECERDILQTLNFEVSYPDPFSVLSYCMLAHENSILLPKNSSNIYYTANYMLDVALFDEKLMNMSSILLGCATIEMSLVINLSIESAFTDPPFNRWRSNFAKSNFTSEEILQAQNSLLRRIAQSGYIDQPEHIVFKKYKRSRYGRISHALIRKVTELIP